MYKKLTKVIFQQNSIISTVEDTLQEIGSESGHPLTTEFGSIAAISSVTKKITVFLFENL